jgi:hypothetical protein
VQRAQALGSVKRPPQRLAVNGDDVVVRRSGRLPQSLQPHDQRLLQRQRADGLEDAPPGIMGRETVVQVEEAAEEGLLGVAEGLEFDEVVTATEHATKADGQDVHQDMAQVLALPGGSGTAARDTTKFDRSWVGMVHPP